MAFTLSRLPPDCLGLLFNDLSCSYLILRLWKCGDLLLNSKLAKSIAHIDLKHHERFRCHFPRLLSNFPQLRILSLSTKAANMSANDPSFEDLKALPKTLESLRVPATVLLDRSRYRPFANDLGRLNDVSSLFPSLLTLKVDVGPLLIPKLALFGSLFSHLPATLTHLSWPNAFITAEKPAFMSVLPRSLTILDTRLTLQLRDEEIPASVIFDMAAAPPGLHTITSVELNPYRLSDYHWLPKTVTRCRIFNPIISWSGVLTLPQGVTEVVLNLISGFPSDIWTSALSKSLVTLRVASKLNSAEIRSLPPSLTSLAFRGFFWNESPNLAESQDFPAVACVWPSGLTKLECDSFALSTDLALLPQSLTVLILPNAFIEFEDEPGTSYFEGIDFPPLLTQLYLHVDENDFDLMQFDFTSLTALNTVKLALEVSGAWALPTSVTKFTVPRAKVEQLFPLPSALVSLTVEVLRGTAEEFISLFSELPPTLKELKLAGLARIAINPKSQRMASTIPSTVFNALPDLEVLLIPFIEQKFESSVLRELHEHNHKLLELDLPLTALYREDVPYLLPNLIKLGLHCDIEWSWPEIEQHWPPLACLPDLSAPSAGIWKDGSTIPEDLNSRLALKARQKYCH